MKVTHHDLWAVLDGIDDCDDAEETFARVDDIKAYAEHGCDLDISDADALIIQSVARAWRANREECGAWGWMRDEARAACAERRKYRPASDDREYR